MGRRATQQGSVEKWVLGHQSSGVTADRGVDIGDTDPAAAIVSAAAMAHVHAACVATCTALAAGCVMGCVAVWLW
jgi:hypothetical protein